MAAHFPPVTKQSVEAARLAQRIERALVTAQTGLTITDEGRIVVRRPKAQYPKRWYCGLCWRWFMSRVECPRCGIALQRAH